MHLTGYSCLFSSRLGRQTYSSLRSVLLIAVGSVSEDEQCVEEVQPYEQCGGGDFEGSTCCRPGYECIDVASCYSLCRPALNGCADSWRQCGGTNYEGPGCCWAGATCTFESEVRLSRRRTEFFLRPNKCHLEVVSIAECVDPHCYLVDINCTSRNTTLNNDLWAKGM